MGSGHEIISFSIFVCCLNALHLRFIAREAASGSHCPFPSRWRSGPAPTCGRSPIGHRVHTVALAPCGLVAAPQAEGCFQVWMGSCLTPDPNHPGLRVSSGIAPQVLVLTKAEVTSGLSRLTRCPPQVLCVRGSHPDVLLVCEWSTCPHPRSLPRVPALRGLRHPCSPAPGTCP